MVFLLSFKITVRKLTLTSFIFYINNIHERALRITYQDYTTSFTDLLGDNYLTIDHRNLQKLVTEIFKVKAGIARKYIFFMYKYDLHVKHIRTKNRYSPGIKTLRGCLGLN